MAECGESRVQKQVGPFAVHQAKLPQDFYYSNGHRIYKDHGKDLGLPVLYTPKGYPNIAPRAFSPPQNPSRGLLLENEKLSSLLTEHLQISVPAERLLGRDSPDDLLAVVLPLIPYPGPTFEHRRAVEESILGLSLAAYKYAMNEVICGFSCTCCGKQLGAAALRLADERYSQNCARARRQHPGSFISVIRDSDAVCSECGTRYFYTAERELARVEDLDRPEHSPQES